MRSGVWLSLAAAVLGSAMAEFPRVPSVTVRYAADHPENGTTEPVAQAFAPEQVDRKEGKLLLPDLGFFALTYPKGLGGATPVRFTSTGSLPTPLQAGIPYYLVPAEGGGYRVFAVASDADAPLQPGGVPGEKVLPAQNAVQGVGAVDFADAGTGIHTVHIKPLISQMTDLGGNGFHSISRNPVNKHALLEIDTDAKGHPFIRTVGALCRENWIGSYNGYGPTFYQGPGERRLDARKLVAGKRVVYQIFVCLVRSFSERQVMKFLIAPEQVRPDSDRIEYAVDARMKNRIKTGDLIQAKAYAGGALPAPLKEGTDYFAHKVDAGTLTLHRNAGEATDGTHPIPLTDSGRGPLLFWLPERVGDSRRWSFFAEVLAPDSGGNTLSARLQDAVTRGGGLLRNDSSFSTSGSSNGHVTGLSTVPELSPIVLWTPPRAELPPPLKPGVRYWISRVPGSGSAVRLHETLASARAAVGKSTAEAGGIAFTGAGRGESLATIDDGASAIAYGTFSKGLEPFSTRMPFDELMVLVFKIDFDPPDSESAVATLGINRAVSETKALSVKKGLTPQAVDDGTAAWTFFNSAQGHVPIDMDLYEVVFGSSAGAISDQEIQAMVDYFLAKYGISSEGKNGETPLL